MHATRLVPKEKTWYEEYREIDLIKTSPKDKVAKKIELTERLLEYPLMQQAFANTDTNGESFPRPFFNKFEEIRNSLGGWVYRYFPAELNEDHNKIVNELSVAIPNISYLLTPRAGIAPSLNIGLAIAILGAAAPITYSIAQPSFEIDITGFKYLKTVGALTISAPLLHAIFKNNRSILQVAPRNTTTLLDVNLHFYRSGLFKEWETYDTIYAPSNVSSNLLAPVREKFKKR